MMAKLAVRDKVFLFMRLLLVLSIIFNIGLILYKLIINTSGSEEFINTELSLRVKLLILAALIFMATFITPFIEKREKIDIPDVLEFIIVAFIYASMYLSTRYNLYYRMPWWDDLLHTLSGLITSSVAFLLIFKLNYKYHINFNPTLIAVFTFCFSMAVAVIWEIMEFTSDVLFKTAHQHWNDTTTVLIGRPYQGAGLRDTMSDLIVTCIGALIMSVIFYFLYKNNKSYVSKTVSDLINEDIEIE